MPAKEPELFKTKIVPAKNGSGKLFDEVLENADRPVTCLGMEFENDDARREYFIEQLREKLKDPEFRQIEGFPIGEDEDILALSNPPYYTACPNPFLRDFIEYYGKIYDFNRSYNKEPFAADVKEGKHDPIYNAHTYHTKVPHKAIMRYVLHYTDPGDIILDGFCGTGMAGVAAQACAFPPKDFKRKIENEWKEDLGTLKWGERKAILCDLSPAATFIANNYNLPIDINLFENESNRIIDKVESQLEWMWQTDHENGKRKGNIIYTVWSDVFICPNCSADIVFYESAVDAESGKVKKEFSCPYCATEMIKRGLERSMETHYDPFLLKVMHRPRRVPVLIKYKLGKKTFQKRPDQKDLEIIKKIETESPQHFVPTEPLMFKDSKWGDLQRNYHEGITHAHHFYFERTLWALSELLHQFNQAKDSKLLRLLFTSQLINISKMNRYRPGVSFPYNPMSGTLYVGSQICESNPFIAYRNKVKKFVSAKTKTKVAGSVAISTVSSSEVAKHIPANSIDYIFVDPPFGDNLPYSELSFLWESWLRVFTNNASEAIVSKIQNKTLSQYTLLMLNCFKAMYLCLKPGKWMTVEFHNSRNSVWSSIQEAIGSAGFVIADVRVLDKGGKTKKQISGANAVKQDLVISAYKPNGGLENRFELEAGTEEGVWDFIRTHLKQLPVFVANNGQSEIISERQNYLLFDRMVAFHVQRGVTIPISAAEFYAALEQRFPYRDGMYFLPDQAAEYDKKRMTVKEVLQLELFVSDEASAIQWLKQKLIKKPQSFQSLHPQFLRELGGWQKHEKTLELSKLLEQNFLLYDGKGPVPSQIHAYLSTDFKDLRNLQKNDPALIAKGKGRWYVPDPNKSGDLEKLREKSLLKEFEQYKSITKKLKIFRLEAVRAGFKKAWQEKDYNLIINIAEKIPNKVMEEDQKLLMWYDQAITRSQM